MTTGWENGSSTTRSLQNQALVCLVLHVLIFFSEAAQWKVMPHHTLWTCALTERQLQALVEGTVDSVRPHVLWAQPQPTRNAPCILVIRIEQCRAKKVTSTQLHLEQALDPEDILCYLVPPKVLRRTWAAGCENQAKLIAYTSVDDMGSLLKQCLSGPAEVSTCEDYGDALVLEIPPVPMVEEAGVRLTVNSHDGQPVSLLIDQELLQYIQQQMAFSAPKAPKPARRIVCSKKKKTPRKKKTTKKQQRR